MAKVPSSPLSQLYQWHRHVASGINEDKGNDGDEEEEEGEGEAHTTKGTPFKLRIPVPLRHLHASTLQQLRDDARKRHFRENGWWCGALAPPDHIPTSPAIDHLHPPPIGQQGHQLQQDDSRHGLSDEVLAHAPSPTTRLALRGRKQRYVTEREESPQIRSIKLDILPAAIPSSPVEQLLHIGHDTLTPDNKEEATVHPRTWHAKLDLLLHIPSISHRQHLPHHGDSDEVPECSSRHGHSHSSGHNLRLHGEALLHSHSSYHSTDTGQENGRSSRPEAEYDRKSKDSTRGGEEHNESGQGEEEDERSNNATAAGEDDSTNSGGEDDDGSDVSDAELARMLVRLRALAQ